MATAALGTAVAGRELERPLRTVLVTGDGSFQLTGNEMSTFLRHKLTPIIIIINNDGCRCMAGARRVGKGVAVRATKSMPLHVS